MIQLDLQSRLPIYEQLRNKIGELILLGELKPDDQLPSVRSFARELGINPNTVQKAYQELERDKVIYSVSGRGSYISPNAGVEQRLQELQLEEVRRATSRSKASGIPEERVVEAVRSVYKEGEEND